jgi:hypothetical protein
VTHAYSECPECGVEVALPWDETPAALHKSVDVIACEVLGHKPQKFWDDGLRCQRCSKWLVQPSAASFAHRNRNGLAEALRAYRTMPLSNCRIVDIRDEALA